MYAPTCKDKLLRDCRVHSLFLWQSTAKLHPTSYLQSNATQPSPSELSLATVLKQGELIPGLGHQAKLLCRSSISHVQGIWLASAWPSVPSAAGLVVLTDSAV